MSPTRSPKRRGKKINHLYSDVYPNREVKDSILHFYWWEITLYILFLKLITWISSLKEKKTVLLEKHWNIWVAFSQGGGKVVKDFMYKMDYLNKDEKDSYVSFLPAAGLF